jgi:hypothetical protein
MKIAIDFVSPENIDRCERLTKEFREQNQSMAWKEDVLQLRTMMWFAWLSCARQERKALTNGNSATTRSALAAASASAPAGASNTASEGASSTSAVQLVSS